MAHAPAQASASVVVGPPLTSLDQATAPSDVTTAIVHQSQPGYRTQSPVDGYITGWRVVGTGTYQLFTGRYTDEAGDVFQRNAYSEPGRGTSLATPSRLFPAQIPIKKGDYIGVAMIAGASIAFKRDIAGNDLDMWRPSLGLQTPTQADYHRDLDNRAGFQAVVELPAPSGGPPPAPTPIDVLPGDAPFEPPLVPGGDPFPVPADALEFPGTGGLSFDRPPRIARAFKARRGALLTFDLSGPATATIEVRRKKRAARRGYRFVGQVSETVGASTTKVRIRRAVDGSRLTRGAYRLRVTATNDAGDTVASRWITFKIRRP